MNDYERLKDYEWLYMLKTWMNQNVSFLIKRPEDVGIKHLNDSKAFME